MMTYTQKQKNKAYKEEAIAKKMEKFEVGKLVKIMTTGMGAEAKAVAEVVRKTKTQIVVKVLGKPEVGKELKFKVSEWDISAIKPSGYSSYSRYSLWYSCTTIFPIVKDENPGEIQKEINKRLKKKAKDEADRTAKKKAEADAKQKAHDEKVEGFWNYKGKELWNEITEGIELKEDGSSNFLTAEFIEERWQEHCKVTLIYRYEKDQFQIKRSEDEADRYVYVLQISGFKRSANNERWNAFSSSDIKSSSLQELVYRLVH